MNILKKRVICFCTLLCIAVLTSCSSKEYGTKKKPASVGQTMHYDGTGASKERNRFQADITLEDVVRGEAAQDIFAAAGGYADSHEVLELDEEEELMVARFTFTLTDVQDNTSVDFSERDVSMFRLVSEQDTSYDYFQQRNYIDGNLFDNAEKGTTQIGALFYIVDKEDKAPSIVFMPSIKEGIWFKTTLDEADKEKVENPLLASDWLDADGTSGSQAGTFNVPLPIGEFGYMKCRSSHFGDYEIELKVNEVLRGEKAEDQLYDLHIYGIEDQKLLESQEYLLINVTANVPSANLFKEDVLIIDSMDFGVINSKMGKAYDYENILYIRPYDLCAIAPGGTATGWIGVIIDKSDDSPMMYYRSLNNKMLYFKLDKAYDVPDGFAFYQSGSGFLENPIRDAKQEKGNWKNPYSMGETVELNYKPEHTDSLASPFRGNICVQEAYKGELAEKLINPDYYTPEPNMELIVLEVAVNVTEVEGDSVPQFDAKNYTLLNGQGGQVVAHSLYADSVKMDGIEEVYPGGSAKGYVAFFVPKGNDNFVMTFGDVYTGLDNRAWIRLEFAEHIPEDIAERLDDDKIRLDSGHFELENDNVSDNENELTAVWSETDIEVICVASGKDGNIQELGTQWVLRFSEEETQDYHAVLKKYNDIVTGLRTGGGNISLESDDEQRIIVITEQNIYDEEDDYKIGYMLENVGIILSDISDKNNVPNMEKLKATLQSYGFKIRNDLTE